MPQGERFTAWFTEEEKRGLERVARYHGASQNSILRIALRAALGLKVPPWARAPAPPRERDHQEQAPA